MFIEYGSCSYFKGGVSATHDFLAKYNSISSQDFLGWLAAWLSGWATAQWDW